MTEGVATPKKTNRSNKRSQNPDVPARYRVETTTSTPLYRLASRPPARVNPREQRTRLLSLNARPATRHRAADSCSRKAERDRERGREQLAAAADQVDRVRARSAAHTPVSQPARAANREGRRRARAEVRIWLALWRIACFGDRGIALAF